MCHILALLKFHILLKGNHFLCMHLLQSHKPASSAPIGQILFQHAFWFQTFTFQMVVITMKRVVPLYYFSQLHTEITGDISEGGIGSILL